MRTLVLGLVAVVCLATTSISAAQATTCVARYNRCQATTDLEIYTGTPTVICNIPYDVYKVTSSATCHGGGSAGPAVFYRCGSQADGFQYSGGGRTHVFALSHGNWEDVYRGRCDVLVYKNQ